jgi:hypothetical protein
MIQTGARATAHAEVLRKVFDLTGHGLSDFIWKGSLGIRSAVVTASKMLSIASACPLWDARLKLVIGQATEATSNEAFRFGVNRVSSAA